MRICIGHVRNDLAVARIYVPNLAGQLHRAAIPEARCAQRLPHTDLDAFQSMHLIDVHLTDVHSYRRASYRRVSFKRTSLTGVYLRVFQFTYFTTANSRICLWPEFLGESFCRELF
jgi:hypothetical protein